MRRRTLSATVPLTLVKHVTHSGPEVLSKTCVAMKFVDDDDDDDDDDDAFTRVSLEPRNIQRCVFMTFPKWPRYGMLY